MRDILSDVHWTILVVASVGAFFGGAGVMFGLIGWRKLKKIEMFFNGKEKP